MKLKDIIDKPNFCPGPWFHSVITPRKTIRPCNDFNKFIGQVNDQETFNDVYNNDNMQELRTLILNDEIHPGCVGCRSKEKQIGFCKRNSLLKGIRKLDLGETELNIKSTTQDIVWYDIRLSNQCNLKCRHCYPALSTTWFEDIKLLKEMEIGKLYTNHKIEYTYLQKNDLDEKFIIDIVNNSKFIQRIEFKGGEPLLKQNLMIKFLKNVNNLKNIQVDICSNGTIRMKDELMEILNKCKLLNMAFSVEGGEDIFKYIRGISLNKIEPIIKEIHDNIKSIVVCFRITQMVYNIFEFPKVYDWIEKLNLTKLYDISIQNYVVFPEFLNVRVLPLEIRKEAQQNLDAFIKKHPTDFTVNKLQKTFSESQLTKEFEITKVFTRDLDNIRNTSFNDIEPRLGKYLL